MAKRDRYIRVVFIRAVYYIRAFWVNLDTQLKTTKIKLGKGGSCNLKFNNPEAITYWDSAFAMVDRQFTNPDSEYHLTPEELYMFLIISLNQRRGEYSVFTSVYMLEESMFFPFTKKSKKENRDRIINSLIGLESKNVILVNGVLNSSSPHKTIYIRINDYEYEEIMKEKEEWFGFNKIVFSDIKDFSINSVYIYCAVKKYDKTDNKNEENGHFNCSYAEWSKILNNIGLSTVKRRIEKAVEEGSIFVNRGDYSEGSRSNQNVNMYRTIKFEEWEKTNRTLLWEKEQLRKELRNIPKGFGEDRGI